MTTIFLEKVICGVCGEKSEHQNIASTNACGSPDLDTRPPAHQRYTINTWVQRCPHCGYCASTIRQVLNGAESVVKSDKYQLQFTNNEYPELENSFLCKAILEKETADVSSAAWSTIHAAWVCDDSGAYESAKKCRMRAVELIKKTESSGGSISEQPGADIAITVDLLRRAGRYDEAIKMIELKKGQIEEEIIKRICACNLIMNVTL
jgi:ribosomal protein L37E